MKLHKRKEEIYKRNIGFRKKEKVRLFEFLQILF